VRSLPLARQVVLPVSLLCPHVNIDYALLGVIAVYHIAEALQTSRAGLMTDILQSHYITVHQSAIRALAWVRVPPSSSTGVPCPDQDPTVIASGGYDGVECLTDVREGIPYVMNRTRGDSFFDFTSISNAINRRHNDR
jgi:hypothetical protein